MSQNQQDQNQQGGDNQKVEKAFQRNMKRMVAILGGTQPTKAAKNKVPNGDVSTLVTHMLKDRREKAQKDMTAELSEILDKVVELETFEKKAKKDMEASVSNKKKELNKAIEACFAKVEDIDALEQAYSKALGQAAQAQSGTPAVSGNTPDPEGEGEEEIDEEEED